MGGDQECETMSLRLLVDDGDGHREIGRAMDLVIFMISMPILFKQLFTIYIYIYEKRLASRSAKEALREVQCSES